MIPYTYKIPNFIDSILLNNILDSIISPLWESLPDPAALSEYTDKLPIAVIDYPFLANIRSKYPKLADHIKFLKSSKGSWPVHCDTHRQTAINIPLRNIENTYTVFHESGKQATNVHAYFGNVLQEWYSNEYVTYITNSKEVYKEILKCPTIVNTSKPHGIINNGSNNRWICSWPYNGTFEEAIEEINVQ